MRPFASSSQMTTPSFATAFVGCWRPNRNWKSSAKPPTVTKRSPRRSRLEPDVLLLDLNMPRLPGMEAMRELSAAGDGKTTKIIVLTAAIERIQIVQALQLGARGVVMKEAATQLLMKAIRTVMAGEYWIGREAVGDIVEFMRLNASGDRPPKNFGLTKREMDILTTIVAGLSNKEIARKFALSEDTVKHHLTNIFDKVGVSSRLELALFAINNRVTDQHN